MRATITLDTLDTSNAQQPRPGSYADPAVLAGPLPSTVHVIEGTAIKAQFDESSKSWRILDAGTPKAIFSQFHVVSITID